MNVFFFSPLTLVYIENNLSITERFYLCSGVDHQGIQELRSHTGSSGAVLQLAPASPALISCKIVVKSLLALKIKSFFLHDSSAEADFTVNGGKGQITDSSSMLPTRGYKNESGACLEWAMN